MPPTKKPSLPTIGLGPCLFMSAPGEPPSVALVTKAGSAISVVAFPTEAHVGLIFETVRHVSDPDYPKYAHLHNGVWDYTDEQKSLRALLAQAK